MGAPGLEIEDGFMRVSAEAGQPRRLPDERPSQGEAAAQAETIRMAV